MNHPGRTRIFMKKQTIELTGEMQAVEVSR